MQPDVLFIVCDTARADAFEPWNGRLRTPAMSRLCREGVPFAHATSQAPWTVPSTSSMFSGRLPTDHGISGDCFGWVDGRPTSPAPAVRAYGGPWLPDILRARGYRTFAASCNRWISRWGGFDRGFDEFADFSDRIRRPRSRLGAIRLRARRLYGKMDRGGRQALQHFARRHGEADGAPFFAFVNLMETHAPYDPPRPFYPFPPWRRARTRRMSGGTGLSRMLLPVDALADERHADHVRTIRELYYRAARYQDWLLGRFVRVIEARGRPTVVVVVSDHGENLGDHGLFSHNSSLWQTLLHVPLVLWGHKVEVPAEPSDRPVSLLRLVDWLRGMADGEPVSLYGDGPIVSEYESTVRQCGIPAELRARIDSGDRLGVPPLVSSPGVAIRMGHLKYVAVQGGPNALFDLDADPAETHDLLPEQSAADATFLPFVAAWEERRATQPPYGAGEIAEGEIADHLRDLGYIE